MIGATEAAERMTRAMQAYAGEPAPDSVAVRYERLRERYVSGNIDLEDFTASVVALLAEGL